MAIELKIREVVLTNKAFSEYDIYAEIYSIEQRIENNTFSFRINTLHDYYFGSLKILFRAKYLSTCLYYAEIRFRSFEDGNGAEMVCMLMDAAIKEEYPTYDFVPREKCGEIRMHYNSRKEDFDLCWHVAHKPNIIDKVFNFFFVNYEEIKVSVLVSKALELAKGTLGSKLNTLKGWLEIQRYYYSVGAAYSMESIGEYLKELSRSKLFLDQLTAISLSSTHTNMTTMFNAEITDSNAAHAPNYRGFRLFKKEFYVYFQNILYYSLAPYGRKFTNFAVPLRANVVDSKFSKLERGILNLLNISPSDLLLVYLDKKDKMLAFIVFLESDRVVISFRGTVNPRDISFDMKFEYSEFYEGYAHDGIKRLARIFIKEHWDEIKEIMARHSKKKILVTGHSLGGGLALLVGYILLRDNLVAQGDMEVVAYSPVPVLSKNLVAEKMDNFISFTYSNDVVPFLSYGTACDVKYLCCSVGAHISTIRKSNSDIGEVIKSIADYCRKTDIHPKLYIPSNMIQFRTFFSNDKTLLFKFLNTFGWKDAKFMTEKIVLARLYDESFFNEVIFDRKTLTDHIPRFLFDSFDQSIQICEHIATHSH